MYSRLSLLSGIVRWNPSDETSYEPWLIMTGVQHWNLAPYVKRWAILLLLQSFFTLSSSFSTYWWPSIRLRPHAPGTRMSAIFPNTYTMLAP